MKTNDDQHAALTRPVPSASPLRMDSAIDPPTRPHTWFNSYNEEWEAFVEEQAIHKRRPGIHNDEPEPLPRVWNRPHG